MRDYIFDILTNLRLERLRSLMPTPVYIGLLTFVLGVPIAAVILIVRGLAPAALRARADWFGILMAPLAGGLALAAMFGALAIVGWVSGYRPYVCAWSRLLPAEARVLEQVLGAAAEELHFEIAWRRPGAGLVAVLGMQIETRYQPQFHEGSRIPVRMVLRLPGMDSAAAGARLVFEGRTITVWDTGETALLQKVGRAVVAAALAKAGPGCPLKPPEEKKPRWAGLRRTAS